MASYSWIDAELSYAFAGMIKPDSEIVLESGLSENDEQAIMLELAKIERIVADRRAALSAQSAAKSRAFRVLRHNRMAGA